MATQKLTAILLAFAVCSLGGTQAHGDASICPPLPPLPEGVDDLRTKETDFTAQRAASSRSYLQKEVPKDLREKDDTKIKRRLESSEFWISYDNSLRIIEGYLLKQEALLQIAQSRLSKTTKTRDAAVKRFCDFLGSAHFAD